MNVWIRIGIGIGLISTLVGWRYTSKRAEVRHQWSLTVTQQLLQFRKPFPVGRYLIDLPASAQDGKWRMAAYGTGHQIHISDMPRAAARAEAEDCASLWRMKRFIQNEDPNRSPLLYRFIENCNTDNTWIVLFWDNDINKDDFLRSSAYHWQFGRRILLERSGGSFSGGDDGKFTIAANIQEIEDIFRRLRVLAPGEIPTEPGWCFQGILMRGGQDIQGERVGVDFTLRDHPDVIITFQAMTNRSEELDPPLLELHRRQMVDLKKAMPMGSVTELRVRGKRDTHGLPGQETALRVKCPQGHHYYNLSWGSQGKPMDVDAQWILLEMTVGSAPNASVPVKPSLSEETILALWDALVDSLRKRPTQG